MVVGWVGVGWGGGAHSRQGVFPEQPVPLAGRQRQQAGQPVVRRHTRQAVLSGARMHSRERTSHSTLSNLHVVAATHCCARHIQRRPL